MSLRVFKSLPRHLVIQPITTTTIILTNLPRHAPRFSQPRRFYSSIKMEPVFTKNAPAPVGPYSQAIKTPTAVYCSGSIPLNAEGALVEGTIAEKTKQCIENLQAVLEEAGSSIEKVVKVTIFLADMGSFVVSGERESMCV
jgi:reactive intermediate/imine deaminase